MKFRFLYIVCFCLIGSVVFSQSFPKLKDLSTGQGNVGDLDPNWLISEFIPSNQVPTNPDIYTYSKALINNNCAPGAWVNPGSLPSPVNNGNWITSQGEDCSRVGISGGFRFFRLILNLPDLCNGMDLNSIYALNFSGYVDNGIENVFVNGVSKNIKGGGYTQNDKIDFQLKDSWKPGLNNIDILVRNGELGNPNDLNPYGLLLVADISKSLLSDLDQDGVSDVADECPCMAGNQANGCGVDSDGDLITDVVDIDDDNDGVPDNIEQYPACDTSKIYNWVKWTSIGDKTAVGEINVNGRIISATVTHSQGGMLQTGGMYASSLFPSNLGVPVSDPSIANSLAGVFTITFSEPVSTPLFAFASVGNPGTIVPIETSSPYNIVWAGQGINYTSSTQFTGQEGYNLIQFPRVGSVFSFNYKQSEYYCNIAFGVKDILHCSGAPEDTDKDGVPNYLDLDSDGDGCSDAFESGATLSKKSDFRFVGSFGKNGLSDSVEFAGDDGILNYTLTYGQMALNKLVGDCVIIDTDGDGVEDEDDIDDDNDGVLDIDEGICNSEYQGFVPINFQIFKYDLGKSSYTISTKNLPSNKLALVANYITPNPGKIDWPTTVASDHIKTYVPANMISYRNGYSSEPNVNITIFRVVVPKGYKNVSQSITRFGVDGGTNIWKNGVLIDGMCCGDEGGPGAPITTTYLVNSGDTIEFRSVNGIPVHQGTKFEFTQIKGKCIVPDDLDTDGDGIVNRLDTDSDGDGCSDAYESGATIKKMPATFSFTGPFGTNGYKDSLETQIENGIYTFSLTYRKAIDSTYSLCGCTFDEQGMFVNDTLTLCGNDASVDPGVGYKYRWKDGTTSQLGLINETGKTFVHVSKTACNFTDTLFVHLISLKLNFKDTTICKGDSIRLQVDTLGWSKFPTLLPLITWKPALNTESLHLKPTKDTLVYCTLTTKLLECKDSAHINLHTGKTHLSQLSSPKCSQDSILVQADTALTYSWNFPGNKRWIKVPSTTKQLVVQVLDTMSCKAIDTLKFSYNLLPIHINSSITQVSCFRLKNGLITVSPIGGVPNYNYSWSTSATNNQVANLDTGKVSLRLTDANGCIKDTVFVITEPLDSLSISFQTVDNVCQGDSIGSIDATVVGGTLPYQFSWTNLAHTEDLNTLKAGPYLLMVHDAKGCEKSKIVTIKELNANPIIDAGLDKKMCIGDSVLLNAKGALSYVWSLGATNNSYVSPSVGQVYYKVEGIDNNGCKGVDSVLFEVFNLPYIDAGTDQLLCNGQSTKVHATGTALSYTWSNQLVDGESFTPQVGETTYVLSGVDENQCTSIDSLKIHVYTYPEIQFTPSDTIGCAPLQVSFNFVSKPDATSFVWDVNGLKLDSLSNPFVYKFDEVGCYKVGLEVKNKICSSYLSKDGLVCIVPKPKARFEPDTNVVAIYAPKVQFSNYSLEAEKYLWKFGDGTISTLNSPLHTFLINNEEQLLVTLIASKDYPQCIDSQQVVIYIDDDIVIYCPNSFTPDGDKLNQVFLPIVSAGIDASTFTMQIYDRWGFLVFETKDTTIGWDGTHKGELLAPDTYTYTISFVDKIKNEKHAIHGHLNLLR